MLIHLHLICSVVILEPARQQEWPRKSYELQLSYLTNWVEKCWQRRVYKTKYFLVISRQSLRKSFKDFGKDSQRRVCMKWVLEFTVVEKEEKCILGRDNNSKQKYVHLRFLRQHWENTQGGVIIPLDHHLLVGRSSRKHQAKGSWCEISKPVDLRPFILSGYQILINDV